MSEPRVGIFGLTGCAGDQLAIINCEDELVDIVGALDIRDFLMASSGNDGSCRLDVALVEGAVLSSKDEERLRQIRERCDLLVAIGTCAVWGGVAAMDRDFPDRSKLVEAVYGEAGASYDTAPARALHELVKVDLAITGCPIEKHQIVAALAQLLNGDAPLLPTYPVCTECKMAEQTCLLTDRGEVCLGPLTVAGCGARCPGLRVACVGCRGPAEDANFPSAVALYKAKGICPRDVTRKLRTFAPVELPQPGGTGA